MNTMENRDFSSPSRESDNTEIFKRLNVYKRWLRKSVNREIARSVNKTIDSKFAIYRRWLTAFLCGAGLLVALGFLPKESVYRLAIKAIYPPDEIYKDIKERLYTDVTFNKQLINNIDFRELTIRTATLNTFPEISGQLSERVWTTIQSGKKEDYAKMVSKNEFYEALLDYHTDLAKSFLMPTLSQSTRKEKILHVGQIPLNVQILMVSKDRDGESTPICYNRFLHNELHAIIVIPKTANPEDYAWFNCSFGWPSIYLNLDAQGNSLNDIRLVGVQRDGGADHLSVRISRRVAERLNLYGWKTYESNTYGKLTVTRVDTE